jgi:hypothetical protein
LLTWTSHPKKQPSTPPARFNAIPETGFIVAVAGCIAPPLDPAFVVFRFARIARPRNSVRRAQNLAGAKPEEARQKRTGESPRENSSNSIRHFLLPRATPHVSAVNASQRPATTAGAHLVRIKHLVQLRNAGRASACLSPGQVNAISMNRT